MMKDKHIFYHILDTNKEITSDYTMQYKKKKNMIVVLIFKDKYKLKNTQTHKT